MGLRIAYLGHAVSEIGAAEKSMRLRGTEGISLVGELLEKVAKLNQDTNDAFEVRMCARSQPLAVRACVVFYLLLALRMPCRVLVHSQHMSRN